MVARIAVWVFALAILMSGCAKAPDLAAPKETVPPSHAPAVPNVDPDLPMGTIAGNVLNDEVVPISGAYVFLVGYNVSAVTNAGGTFRFEKINVGDYFLVVRASGYREVQMGVSVREGETAEMRLTLASIPVPVPRIETLPKAQSLNCRAVVGHPAGTTNLNTKGTCPWATVTGVPNNQFGTLTVQPGLVGFLAELKWTQGSQASHNMDLKVTLPHPADDTGGLWEYHRQGASPGSLLFTSKTFADYLALHPKRANYHATGGMISYWVEVAPGLLNQPVDVGVAMDQRIDLLFTFVYVVEPASYESLYEFT